ncbi:MAG: hypothetical protein K2X01_10640 [Cyanobacteria bacterium]|nr:hypothetical protein [Cyanobacteriota bacterium]
MPIPPLKQRWYDQHPTLSMAVSLLQNANKTNQRLTSEYMYSLLDSGQYDGKATGALAPKTSNTPKTSNPLLTLFSNKRVTVDRSVWKVLETMRHMSPEQQQELALLMIEYIYHLDLMETVDQTEITPANAFRSAM